MRNVIQADLRLLIHRSVGPVLVPDGDVVVGNEFSGTLSFIKDGEVIGTNDMVQQPGSVINSGHTVVIADVRAHTVSTFDLSTMKRTNVASAGEGPTHAALLPGNRVAIIDTRGNQVLLYDIKTLRQVGNVLCRVRRTAATQISRETPCG